MVSGIVPPIVITENACTQNEIGWYLHESTQYRRYRSMAPMVLLHYIMHAGEPESVAMLNDQHRSAQPHNHRACYVLPLEWAMRGMIFVETFCINLVVNIIVVL